MSQIIIYDWDAAPDAEEYIVAKRVSAESYHEARDEANFAVEEKFYVGAKVLNAANQVVYTAGLAVAGA